MQGVTHIIGAGLSGLSAATTLAQAGRKIIVYEASSVAGGRCRSYYDEAFGATIDNGNHLLLSGNEAALAYLKRIGAADIIKETDKPHFDFIDAGMLKHWTLKLNEGAIPFWLMNKNSRVPDSSFGDYFSVLKLLQAGKQDTITSLISDNSLLYRRLWHILFLSALNTHPASASAQLAGAVLRGSLLKGGKACIPIVADGLSALFIDPALRYLAEHQANVQFNQRVRHIEFRENYATTLAFTTGEPIPLSENDIILCAVSASNIASLLPGIMVPDMHNAILNAHFKISPPAGFPRIMGVINATTEWIFSFPERISVTISDAGELMAEERERLAERIWQEVSAITGLTQTLPTWQIVKEKRATFAATPEQNAKRPPAHTSWRNVYIAGDYVQTGLPATIEGAIRSGENAANLIMGKI